MARPQEKDRARIRTERLVIRARKEERAKWEAKAQRLGMTVSEYIRSLANRDSRM